MRKKEKQLSHVDTIIGSGTTFNGDLTSSSSIRIDGKVSGSVKCEGDVVIGSEGVIEANVEGRNITLAGTINGQVTAKQTLKIESTGTLNGDASMSVFIIDEGGKFDGTSKMKKEETGANGNQDKGKKNKDKAS
ncbi:bactofilin family protein [Bacillaceae bacterium W0354]